MAKLVIVVLFLLLFLIHFYLFACLFWGKAKGDSSVQKIMFSSPARQMVCFLKLFGLVHNGAHQTFGKEKQRKLKNKNNLVCYIEMRTNKVTG